MRRCESGKTIYKVSEWRGTRPRILYERKGAPLRLTVDPIRREGGGSALHPAALVLWPESTRQADNGVASESIWEKDLAALQDLQSGWDDGTAEVPAGTVIAEIERVLGKLLIMGATPTAIRPSSEGGAGICFSSEKGYGHIELLNTGEIFGLAYSTDRDPESWQIEDIDTELKLSLDRIRAHV